MAKRKRRPGHGSKVRPIKDYRDDEYTPYIFRAETGILEAWTIEPDLRDGDVRQALRSLIKNADKWAAILAQEAKDTKTETETLLNSSKHPLLHSVITSNLRQAFQEHEPLNAEDLAGILKVINNSVGTWNRGMRGQEYLKYIKDFLGGMGAAPRMLSPEEVEALELVVPEDIIEGEYDEIE